MIAPSITFDHNEVPPIWADLTVQDVQDLIRFDVAELHRCLKLQADDLTAARLADRQPDYRIRTFIQAWEITQDVHWSWHKEILNARSDASDRPEGLGSEAVGRGYEGELL
jgi:hypothetical protein